MHTPHHKECAVQHTERNINMLHPEM
jgi:hypothetical protein